MAMSGMGPYGNLHIYIHTHIHTYTYTYFQTHTNITILIYINIYIGEDPIVASGCRDGSVFFWDPDTFEIIDKLQFNVAEVRSLSIYQGRNIYMMIGSRDSRILVWDLKLNAMVIELTGHKGCIHSVLITSYCPDPDTMDAMDYLCVATGATDRTARLWDITTGKRKTKLRHEHSVLTVALASKGIQPILATAGVEKLIRLWDLETGMHCDIDRHMEMDMNGLIYAYDVCVFSCVSAYIYIKNYMYVNTHIHKFSYIYTYLFIFIHIYTYLCIYIYIY